MPAADPVAASALLRGTRSGCQANRSGPDRAFAGEAEPGMAPIHVRDLGEGIPADRLPRIFEKYQTSGNHVTGTRRGVGIRL